MKTKQASKKTILRGVFTLHGYNGHHLMARDCLWLLLGYPWMTGAFSQMEIAERYGVSKQAVSKCILWFQARMPELPKIPGQRTKEDREAMCKARNAQLVIP